MLHGPAAEVFPCLFQFYIDGYCITQPYFFFKNRFFAKDNWTEAVLVHKLCRDAVTIQVLYTAISTIIVIDRMTQMKIGVQV